MEVLGVLGGLQYSFSFTDKRRKPFQDIFLSPALLPAWNMDVMSRATAAESSPRGEKPTDCLTKWKDRRILDL